jgi:hypothetical protein
LTPCPPRKFGRGTSSASSFISCPAYQGSKSGQTPDVAPNPPATSAQQAPISRDR